MFFYLIILLIGLLAIQYYKKLVYYKKRGIPYLPPSLLLGLETLFLDTPKVYLERSKKYGKVYGTFFGNFPLLVISDPEMAKEVTIKEGQNFTETNPIKLNIKYFKDIFLLKKGKEWKDGRAIVSPVFTTKKIKEIFNQFQKASKPLFSNIESLIEEGKNDEIDIKLLLRNYGLDVIAKFVFAIDINSAKDNENPFVKNVLRLVNFNNDKIFSVLIAILPSIIVRKFSLRIFDLEAMEYLADLTRSLIKQRNENKDQEYNDFLDLLLTTIREKDVNVPDDEIVGLCILFYFAGLETVSTTISNVFYALILNPEYQDKLYAELISLFPNKEIGYEDITQSTLLDAVLKESQRVYPVVNMLFRVAENPIEIKGVKIEAKEVVGIDVYSMHHSADYWGDDVDKFRPERFFEKDVKFENDDIFRPFGSGLRACIASRFAVVQVKYVMAMMVLNYEVYRTKYTAVPPVYIKNPQQLTFKNMVMGFRKR